MAKQDDIRSLMDCVVNTPEELQAYFAKCKEFERSFREKSEDLFKKKETQKLQDFRKDMYDQVYDMLFPLPSKSNWFAFFCASSHFFFLIQEEEKRDLLFNVLANFKNVFEPNLAGTTLNADHLFSKSLSMAFDRKKKIIDSMKLNETLESRWNTFKRRLLEKFPGLFAFLNLEMPVTQEMTKVVEEALSFVPVSNDTFLNQSISLPDSDSFLDQEVSLPDDLGVLVAQDSTDKINESLSSSPLFAPGELPPPPANLGPGEFLPPDDTTSEEEPILPAKGRRTPEESFVEVSFVVEDDVKENQQKENEQKENEDDFLNQEISLGM